MTKGELVKLLDKYDDENEIEFEDLDISKVIQLDSIKESATSDNITLQFIEG